MARIRYAGYISRDQVTPEDPINLVFFGNAPAAKVADLLENQFLYLNDAFPFPEYQWRPRLSDTLYARFYDLPPGGGVMI